MTLSHDFVNIGPKGTFADSGMVHSRPADVDGLVDRLRAAGTDKVVLHFHGGLVSESAAMRLVERLLPIYAGAGAHGIGIIWETGLLETVSRNLNKLNGTKLFNKLLNYAIRHAAKWVGADTGARGPGGLMAMAEVEKARRSDAEIERMDVRSRGGYELDDVNMAEVEAELLADLENDPVIESWFAPEDATLLDPDAIEGMRAAGARGIFTSLAVAKLLTQVVVRVVRRFATERDHGVIATVVEEVLRAAYLGSLGAWIWTGMKTAAEDMWRPNTEPIGVDSHAGSYLLDRLAAVQAERPALTIDLVGHSAGSIAVCGLVETAASRHPGFRIRNVMLLAPACTPEVFERGILAHQDRISQVRVFGMCDELERRDRLVPGVYPSSLLYLVSGVLETEMDCPLVGLDRHTSGRSAYAGVERLGELHAFLHENGRDRLVLSKTEIGTPGMLSAATTHGEFDDEQLTIDSLVAMIAS